MSVYPIYPQKRDDFVIARGIGEDARQWYHLYLRADYESVSISPATPLASSTELSDIENGIAHLCAGPIYP